jgi:ATP-dependent Lhr-like helicase
VDLASTVRAKAHDKYDRYLSDDLLDAAYAARALDVPGAWATLAELAAGVT